MQNATQIHQTSHLQAATKALTASLIGGAVTFGLFALMHGLIDQEAVGVSTLPEPVIIDAIFKAEEETIVEREKLPEPPQIKEIPDRPIENPVDIDEPDTQWTYAPTIDTGTTLTDILSFGMQDSELRPLVRVDPRYPIDAARDGIEGWVQMTFNVNELGGVTDIQVINAEPKRVFNQEAKRALAKWKYQPKSVNGKAVAQQGLSVVLEFTLADN
ncbi:TonB family protein [Alteromonas sp. ASW11-36]|uniref:Protein TonB n=1 Tax=Alteromonas arenosi TaxID=3055817 RepID=A0ABT7SZC6_9ALTE|nr:TonB family protein [Alteromonas sp. ASW11-36]MDM7861526.1 TonB family protein [Alteromonas sp. ASW11-36]